MLFVALLYVYLSDPTQIKLDDVGLTLSFTAEWQLVDKAGPFTALAERPPREALAMFTRAPMSAEQAEKHYLDGMNKALAHAQILQQKQLMIGTIPTRRIALSGKAGEQGLNQLTYIFQGSAESYTLTFATIAERFSALEPEFDTIAMSLHLDTPKVDEHLQAFWAEIILPEPNLDHLESLIKDIDINAKTERAKTPLIHAIITRNGPLVRWLLQHGADPDHPNNDSKLMNLVASPPILALLVARRNGDNERPAKGNGHLPDNFQWASAEAELFSGIEEGFPQRVKSALSKDVDLKARDKNYRLPALAMTRKLIAEFRELELDPGALPEIEQLLVQAEAQKQ